MGGLPTGVVLRQTEQRRGTTLAALAGGSSVALVVAADERIERCENHAAVIELHDRTEVARVPIRGAYAELDELAVIAPKKLSADFDWLSA